jgi:hypothetical protein
MVLIEQPIIKYNLPKKSQKKKKIKREQNHEYFLKLTLGESMSDKSLNIVLDIISRY